MTDRSVPGLTRVLIDDIRIAPAAIDRAGASHNHLPHSSTGVHRHNGPVFGVIESGTAVVQIDDGPTVELHPGDTFHEPADTRIRRFDAADEELVFLAWFPIGDGREPALIPLDD